MGCQLNKIRLLIFVVVNICNVTQHIAECIKLFREGKETMQHKKSILQCAWKYMKDIIVVRNCLFVCQKWNCSLITSRRYYISGNANAFDYDLINNNESTDTTGMTLSDAKKKLTENYICSLQFCYLHNKTRITFDSSSSVQQNCSH